MIQPMLLFLMALLFTTQQVAAQTITEKLKAAFQQFESDPQLQHALISLYVVDNSGQVVFHQNETIGLAPASTQKIITTATAYELLGKNFTYKTNFCIIKKADGTNSLYIKGSGDPTLGSWRWPFTKDLAVLKQLAPALSGVTLDTTVIIDTSGWDFENIPGGWIWEDVGNYYGAGAGVFNWHENQYDIYLRSDAVIGSPVAIAAIEPAIKNYTFLLKVVAAEKGSGDNAFIFFSPVDNAIVVRGTIPVNENHFSISGALPEPAKQFATALLQQLHQPESKLDKLHIVYTNAVTLQPKIIYTQTSPPLDSLIYWLDKKSINLYGEALLKTIAFQKTGAGSTEAGVGILQRFWQEKGIAPTALNIVDGSGLSPLNRVTTQAQVAILQYAKKQSWFAGFYKALPEYNGMKLKSGTIHGVKGFAGYHTSRSGASYTLSFLVNNYNGNDSVLVKKMYAVLDVLK